MKTCTTCKEEKEISCFYKKRNSHEAECKVCKNRKSAERRAADPTFYLRDRATAAKRLAENPELAQQKREYAADYYQKNRSKCDEHTRNWYKNNPDKRLAMHQRWQQANLDVVRFHSNKRRAMKLKATPTWADSEWDQFVVAEAYHLAILREQASNIVWHVDHIVPLQSELVCGLHCASNLQVITAFENISKNNRYWPDM